MGGRPPVDKATWPRWMHCIAQLDLSEIAAQNVAVRYSLPDTGLLVFFADTDSFSGSDHQGAVCYVPNEELDKEHEPPVLRPVYGEDWNCYDITAGSVSRSDAPTIFPRWPIK
ncbi:DUF1963 domain-containing protein [Jannaschia aquimarina]|uniref:DUF1963 domain-containing protein n=1 Tax=Jannaschia aquimarina TaxID=935700 RepID=UPI0013792CDA